LHHCCVLLIRAYLGIPVLLLSAAILPGHLLLLMP
jgi:hypothetical protein